MMAIDFCFTLLCGKQKKFFFSYSNMGKEKGVNLQSNRTSSEKAEKHIYKQETVSNGDHL